MVKARVAAPDEQEPDRRRPPTREAVLDYLTNAGVDVQKRDIARAFKLTTEGRRELKTLLRQLENEGVLQRAEGKRFRPADALPAVAVLRITAIDAEGELLAEPVSQPEAGEPIRDIRVLPDIRRGRAPTVGDRVLARLARTDEGWQAKLIKTLPRGASRVAGVLEQAGQGFRLRPADRKAERDYVVPADSTGDALPGELVVAEIEARPRLGVPKARVVERIGSADTPAAISLLAAYEAGIRLTFPQEAIDLAEAAGPPGLGDRVDLRGLALVTIDGDDARDFDDAVFAMPDPDAANAGGWRVTVAIADVAHYVRPDDALDREAALRGNSVYFPDRVVPMLPEALSNNWCSLRPDEDRACIVAHLTLTADGTLAGHRFERALMRSRARLTYEQVQDAIEERTDATTEPLLDAVIRPLYRAFEALKGAAARRGLLDLDLPEMRVVTDPEHVPVDVAPRARLDSHRLIEQFMIAANVAAAETLEKLRQPCMYRIHDKPDPVKVEALVQFLESLGEKVSGTSLRRPMDFQRLLDRFRDHDLSPMLQQFVLRCQSQAVYSPDNVGHFGLGLPRYAHFTSPIRRYSDLLVHRALIRGLKLGDGALPASADHAAFQRIGEQISMTERAAMTAERRAVDRFISLYLADKTGAYFAGHVGAVQRFGLFVHLDEVGADGLVPVSTLGTEYFRHEAAHHILVGERTGTAFGLGDKVMVQLVEADPVTGSLLLKIIGHTPGAAARRWQQSGIKPIRRRPVSPARQFRGKRRR
ncbi:ribonuclease R [Marinivivus vitaminiproducens]|uniref:ribonuclease R n=1 Tax=Marinivivus vitaminiproducens TaxID=3035935 RepID=UPI00279ECF9E|nr:ribonuclease R [Geminicoccaceae bacterium SCSIO 64248]